MVSSWEEEKMYLTLQELEAKAMVSSQEEERMHLILQELETMAMVSSWEEKRMHFIYKSFKDQGNGQFVWEITRIIWPGLFTVYFFIFVYNINHPPTQKIREMVTKVVDSQKSQCICPHHPKLLL